MSKYIIIDAEAIQKRIEELENFYTTARKVGLTMDTIDREIETLKQIISQSTPLIPVLEQAYSKSETNYLKSRDYSESFIARQKLKEDYISNLKLDI